VNQHLLKDLTELGLWNDDMKHKLIAHNGSIQVQHTVLTFGKGKGRTLDIAPQVDTATTKALRYMARTKQRRTYLPYTFPAIAGTHLPTLRGWRVE